MPVFPSSLESNKRAALLAQDDKQQRDRTRTLQEMLLKLKERRRQVEALNPAQNVGSGRFQHLDKIDRAIKRMEWALGSDKRLEAGHGVTGQSTEAGYGAFHEGGAMGDSLPIVPANFNEIAELGAGAIQSAESYLRNTPEHVGYQSTFGSPAQDMLQDSIAWANEKTNPPPTGAPPEPGPPQRPSLGTPSPDSPRANMTPRDLQAMMAGIAGSTMAGGRATGVAPASSPATPADPYWQATQVENQPKWKRDAYNMQAMRDAQAGFGGQPEQAQQPAGGQGVHPMVARLMQMAQQRSMQNNRHMAGGQVMPEMGPQMGVIRGGVRSDAVLEDGVTKKKGRTSSGGARVKNGRLVGSNAPPPNVYPGTIASPRQNHFRAMMMGLPSPLWYPTQVYG